VEDEDSVAVLLVINDEIVGPSEALTLPMQLVTCEFIYVLDAVRLLSFGDEQPNLVTIAEAEDSVVDRCVLDREQILQLGSGVDVADCELVRGNSGGSRQVLDAEVTGIAVISLGDEQFGCVSIQVLTSASPYSELAHGSFNQVQQGLCAGSEEGVEVSRTQRRRVDG